MTPLMKHRWTMSLIAIAAVGLTPALTLAQSFFGGGVAFNPEISIVHSGTLLDAQVVVSHDRRYVTITTNASQSRVQGFETFPVSGFTGQGGGGGAAGGGGGGAAPGGARLGFVGGAGYIDDEQNNLPADVKKPDQSKESAERAAHPERPAPVPKDPAGASPSEILKTDSTAANSVLRKEGMFLLTTK